MRSCFKNSNNKIICGFGNRKNDLSKRFILVAYKYIGIPDNKIFIINEKG